MLNRLTVSTLLKAVILVTSVCRGGWIFAQRLGLLGPPAGGQPHSRDRGCLGHMASMAMHNLRRPTSRPTQSALNTMR